MLDPAVIHGHLRHLQEWNRNDGSSIERLKFLSPGDVRGLAEKHGTPLYVYDEATMGRNASHLMSLPSAFGLAVRYSINACANQAVISIFDRIGLSFDASSVWQAQRALRAGVQPSKVLLTAQQTELSDGLAEVIEAGVEFNACSLRQLNRFGQAWEGMDVSVRINPGFGSGLGRRLTPGGPDSSFGIWHESMTEALEIAERHRLRIKRLHTHIGAGHHRDVLIRAAEALLRFARVMPDVTTINLGGGYRVKALRADPECDHSEWAREIAALLRDFSLETGRRLRLEIESGTYLMATAGSIVTKVIDVVSTGAEAGGGRTFVKIDGVLTEVMRPSYSGTAHPLVSVSSAGLEPQSIELYCVTGHCRIAGDALTTKVGDVERLEPVLLRSTQVGDYIVIERGGSYCSSMTVKNFDSFPEAPEVLRRSDGSFDLIRVRQTFDQMIGNERIPADLASEETEPEAVGRLSSSDRLRAESNQ
jgi:diaminopimelate decarboxylase